MKSDHETIYLEPLSESGEYGFDGRTWCQDNVYDAEQYGAEATKYIRADLAEAEIDLKRYVSSSQEIFGREVYLCSDADAEIKRLKQRIADLGAVK